MWGPNAFSAGAWMSMFFHIGNAISSSLLGSPAIAAQITYVGGFHARQFGWWLVFKGDKQKA